MVLPEAMQGRVRRWASHGNKNQRQVLAVVEHHKNLFTFKIDYISSAYYAVPSLMHDFPAEWDILSAMVAT